MANIAIIGGGISGLSAAHFFSKLSGRGRKINKIVIYEATDRVGGWIQTKHMDDGTLFEAGPRSVRPVGAAAMTTLSVVEDLGLCGEVVSIPRSHSAAKTRMIYANSQLNLLPNKFADLLRINPPLTKRLLPVLAGEFRIPKTQESDESVYNFFRRRFGEEVRRLQSNQAFLKKPEVVLMIRIFAGDSKQLSMRSCFKDLWNLEQTYGSIVRGVFRKSFGKRKNKELDQSILAQKAVDEKWAVWSIRNGLNGLPKAIERNLSDDHRIALRKNQPVMGLEFTQSGKVLINSRGVMPESESFDFVISAVYAPLLGSILPATFGDLMEKLNAIPAVTVAVLNLEFSRKYLPQEAFGYLVPSNQNSKILGVIFDSCLFQAHNPTKQNVTRLTCMLGGAYFERHFGSVETVKPEILMETALQELGQHLHIHETPIKSCLSIHKNCIPQYFVGHEENVRKIRDLISQTKLPLSLIGSSFDGVGLNDCIHGGRLAAEYILNLI